MPRLPSRTTCRFALVVVCAVALFPAGADAYVGPGAGFAVLSSFFVLLTTLVVVALSLLLWPMRALWRLVGRIEPRSAIGRLIVVGFDGQDPQLTDTLMAEGALPHFARLADTGCYRRLKTTFPAVSPVAWSSFSTGTHPGRHNIFDFITPDRRTYLPRLSSASIDQVTRYFRFGRHVIPRSRPGLTLLRRSKPFWAILGEHRIWSTILRVPITFPPDRFYGAQLSAMCVPDVLGSQGTFVLFTTRAAAGAAEGGTTVAIDLRGDRIETALEGPPNPYVLGHPPLSAALSLVIDRAKHTAALTVSGTTVPLAPNRLSDWVRVTFRVAPGIRVTGLTRFQLLEVGEHVSLYAAPINLDPERPAMPISHPPYYATYLAKRIGSYATLGLAEDTSALNGGVIDEATFLQQTYDIDRERRSMFFAALDRLQRGTVVCVFDATDRIQHMFWRYTDPRHPALPDEVPAAHASAIRDLYRHNDALLGEIVARLRPDDVLMVISDHGFTSFRRGVNLNSWLLQHGYLALRSGTDGTSEWLRDVDWSRTRAYSFGLTGLFLNVRGREREGIVAPGDEAAALKKELSDKLTGLVDTERGETAIRTAVDPATLYDGPYLANGPDLLVGYNAGYRVSWGCATGTAHGPVFSDNVKAWSGDHCIDPQLVPGVFFCNKRVETEEPALIDIAPTALQLFGIDPPAYMDGRPLTVAP